MIHRSRAEVTFSHVQAMQDFFAFERHARVIEGRERCSMLSGSAFVAVPPNRIVAPIGHTSLPFRQTIDARKPGMCQVDRVHASGLVDADIGIS